MVPQVTEDLRVLPLLYLHGLSSGDFVPALEQFPGSAVGPSSATAIRLTKQWQDDHAAFQERDLSDRDFVCVWDDGVHPKVRLGQANSCVLVLLGVRMDGTKELIALAEGLQESTESWTDPLRDCRRRGMRDPRTGRRRRCHGPSEGAGPGLPGRPPSKMLCPGQPHQTIKNTDSRLPRARARISPPHARGLTCNFRIDKVH
ncbi:hypothetical protein QFZ32_000432 [Streptomyces canus]|nr:hypothetical protein [Streptomyces canus]